MNNIFLQGWHRYVPSLRLFPFISGFIPRIEIRGYKIVRAYGSGLPLAIAGNGIPQKILDKIFQPPSDRFIQEGFFTTKPTGLGTGLELSLSYDIVKAHGGEIKVETKQGDGTGFIIQIPIY